jgi:hypothetical protein
LDPRGFSKDLDRVTDGEGLHDTFSEEPVPSDRTIGEEMIGFLFGLLA